MVSTKTCKEDRIIILHSPVEIVANQCHHQRHCQRHRHCHFRCRHRHSYCRPLLGFFIVLLFLSQECQSTATIKNEINDNSSKSNGNGNGGHKRLLSSYANTYSEGGYGDSSSSSSSSSRGSFFTRGRDRSPSSSSSSSSSSRSHYGSSSSYGSYESPSSSSYSSSRSKYGGGSSSGSYGSYGSGSGSYKYQHEEPMVPLAWVILLVITFVGIGMLITANEFIYNTEGNLANFCRLSVKILDCIWRIIYNCYHCRLSEIPNVVWTAIDDDDDDENGGDGYTEEELQMMKLRPGIERALDVEHNRSMNRMKKEFSKNKKTEMGKKIAKKVGVAESRGNGLKSLLGEKRTYARVNDTEDKEDQS